MALTDERYNQTAALLPPEPSRAEYWLDKGFSDLGATIREAIVLNRVTRGELITELYNGGFIHKVLWGICFLSFLVAGVAGTVIFAFIHSFGRHHGRNGARLHPLWSLARIGCLVSQNAQNGVCLRAVQACLADPWVCLPQVWQGAFLSPPQHVRLLYARVRVRPKAPLHLLCVCQGTRWIDYPSL